MSGYKKKTGGRRAQRGVAALLTAIFMLTAVLCLAFVVDTGRLYFEKRSLQRVADMAALDAASQAGACGGSSGGSNVVQAAQASAVRNSYTGNLANAPNSVTLGDITTTGGLRTFSASGASSSQAVQVIATLPVPASLIAGGIFGKTVTLSATAVAERTPIGSFAIGSGLLTLNSAASPLLGPVLNGLLGTNINLSAVSYNGIADANINLLSFLQAVQVQAGLGSVQDVLNSNVSLLSVVQATANLMSQNSDSTVATVGTNLLGSSLASISGLTVNLGQLLGLQAGQNATNDELNTSVNAFNLLLASAEVANGTHAVALNLAVPGITSASLTVIQPPVIAVGPVGTTASTGQVALDLVLNPAINIGDPALTSLANVSVDMDVRVYLANGTATLSDISCSTLASPTTGVTINAQSNLAEIGLSSASNHNNPANITISVLGINILNVELSIAGSGSQIAQSGTIPLQYSINRSIGANGLPENTITPSATQRVSSQVSLNPQISILKTTVLGTPLGVILQPIVNIVNGSGLTAALSQLLNNVIGLLGIQIGYADVTLFYVNEPGARLVI